MTVLTAAAAAAGYTTLAVVLVYTIAHARAARKTPRARATVRARRESRRQRQAAAQNRVKFK